MEPCRTGMSIRYRRAAAASLAAPMLAYSGPCMAAAAERASARPAGEEPTGEPETLAKVQTPHGLHPLRHHRCRRAPGAAFMRCG
jgi:hypothetical protein